MRGVSGGVEWRHCSGAVLNVEIGARSDNDVRRALEVSKWRRKGYQNTLNGVWSCAARIGACIVTSRSDVTRDVDSRRRRPGCSCRWIGSTCDARYACTKRGLCWVVSTDSPSRESDLDSLLIHQTSQWTDQSTPRRSLSANMGMSDLFAAFYCCIRSKRNFWDCLNGRAARLERHHLLSNLFLQDAAQTLDSKEMP